MALRSEQALSLRQSRAMALSGRVDKRKFAGPAQSGAEG
jgi:hypothetical protein